MQKKRIFIAVNLPQGVRDELEHHVADLALKVSESVRFVTPEFLHFTLTFLGDQPDEGVGEVVAAMRELVPQFPAPEITITGVAYGPPGKTPRMIWAITDEETSEALGEIKSALEDTLADRGVTFERESRKYNAHLTLARFERIAQLPDIETPLNLRFTPESVDLVEAHLKRSGAEYDVMAEVEFGV